MYDYIVVGAGSAGCVLASRLSEDPQVSVLLLEAGGEADRPEISIPAAWPSLLGTDVDWGYLSEPEPALGGRPVYLPRGRVLGGSSSTNALVYVRGNRRDFDEWRDLGNDGWSFEDVLPYFMRSEDNSRGASDLHGTGGPLAVSDLSTPHPASHAFVAAAKHVGIPVSDDINGAEQEGATLTQITARDGQRSSTASSFLAAARTRSNLTVVTGAVATRVVLEDGAAVGVELRRDGELVVERAAREVLVSAGAVDSPKLLMLSGIGEPDALARHGLPVHVALPGVGQNLQDHPCVAIGYTSSDPTPPAHDSNLVEAVMFTSTGVGPDTTRPDLEMPFGPILYVAPPYRREGPGFTFVALLTRPTTAGTVQLRSADPEDRPVITLRFFEHPEDVDVLVRGIELAREMAASPAFDGIRGEEVAPGAQVVDRADLAAYVREAGDSLYHMAGTCRMGVGDDAVVDPQLRVHGVRGLRVVDASIMPTITTGNTNAATIMIAERAADLIRNGGPSAST